MLASRRRLLALYGLPLVTAVLAAAAIVLELISLPVGVAIAMFGVLVTATLEIVTRYRADSDRRTAKQRALTELGDAAKRFRDWLAVEFPADSSVPEGAGMLREVAQQMRDRRFNFRTGQRWSNWATMGHLVQRGRADFLESAGLVGDRLSPTEEDGVRRAGDLARRAAKYAFEIASWYAGYDVTEEPKVARYMPEDREVEVREHPAYTEIGELLTALLDELDRMGALSPDPVHER